MAEIKKSMFNRVPTIKSVPAALVIGGAVFWAGYLAWTYQIPMKLAQVLSVTQNNQAQDFSKLKFRSDVYADNDQVLLEKIRNSSMYKEAYEQIVDTDMDLPMDDWEDVRHAPVSSFFSKRNKNKIDLGFQDEIWANDEGDLGAWLMTPDWQEFLYWGYKHLEDFLIKKAHRVARLNTVLRLPVYLEAYKKFTSEALKIKDGIWLKIRRIPKKYLADSVNSTNLVLIIWDVADRNLQEWLKTSDWIEFLKGDYIHLEDYLIMHSWLSL